MSAFENSVEKGKMFRTSTLSFSYNVFYPSQNKFQFLSHFLLSSANAFNLDESKILSSGKELSEDSPDPVKQRSVLGTWHSRSSNRSPLSGLDSTP